MQHKVKTRLLKILHLRRHVLHPWKRNEDNAVPLVVMEKVLLTVWSPKPREQVKTESSCIKYLSVVLALESDVTPAVIWTKRVLNGAGGGRVLEGAGGG